jgi:teichuronic acid biosynthesis glycosyltransferase TuaG
MPLVSIIMPAWNASRLIGQSIASVQGQTLGDWELLIADDCSTDNTTAIIEAIAEADPRVHLIRQSKNGGPAVARQAALDQATGRFVAFLDSDDLWLPPKLEKQIAFMVEREAALSYTAFRRISEDGDRIGRLHSIPPSMTYRQLMGRTVIACLTAVIDRQVAGDIHIADEPYDDFVLWLSILKRGHVAHGLAEDLARYRVRQGSVSSRPLRSMAWVWHIYRKVERLSLPHALWCLGSYGFHAAAKRGEF